MIDLTRIERWLTEAKSPVIAIRTEQLAELLAEAKSGRVARRELVRERAFGGICAGIAAAAVPTA